MYYPGSILLWASFVLGLASTVAFALSIRDERWRSLARQTYALMTVAVVLASVLLMYLFVTHDYRLFYVASYSDNSLPWQFLVSSFWAGQEGSFLLWIFWSALLGLAVIRFARHYESRVMIFYNLTVLSLIMLLLKQDPFRFHQGLTAGMIPMDGQGLNPLLQNPWMVIHPPIMFLGYASLAVPFAFALAALWMRRYDEWTRASMPWVLLSLVTLGTAIMLGGYWAYETLGWGGYWGWDPVENASLVPWLMTAALTHGFLLQRGRKRFRKLNLVLAVLAYLFVVYGTFLTRSGVLANFSVHSFVDLGITAWLVFNMMFFLVVSIILLALRWKEIPTEVGDEPFLSRTIFFVIGIVLLIATGLMVALGTSAPLITELFTKPAKVGPDFYNRVGMPLAIALGLILGSIPFLAWKGPVKKARKRFGLVVALSVGLTGVGIVLGARQPLVIVYLLAAFFATTANGWTVIERVRRGTWRAAGGYVTHVGLGLMLLAFLTSGLFDRTTKLHLVQDRPVKALGYTLTFRGVEKPTPQARDAMVVEVTSPSGKRFVLKPKMWINRKTNQLVANPDIKSFIAGDLYLAPAQFNPAEEPPVSGTLLLTKNQPKSFRDWRLEFKGFDLSGQHAVAGAVTVAVEVEIDRPGEKPIRVKPSIISTDQGVQAISVPIPGTAAGKARVSGMDASNGIVRIELLGLGGGVARTAVLHRGESLRYNDLAITFDDFDLSDFDPQAGKIHIGAVFNVEDGAKKYEVEPRFLQSKNGPPETRPAEIPGTGGISLTLGKIDANGGAVELRVYDPSLAPQPPKPASLVLDVTTKPLISLVWVGTLFVIAGILVAMFLRRRDLASIPIRDD